MRQREKVIAASTAITWQTKLNLLSSWCGSDQIGLINRKQADAFKAFMLDRGLNDISVRSYISCYSEFVNWALRTEVN